MGGFLFDGLIISIAGKQKNNSLQLLLDKRAMNAGKRALAKAHALILQGIECAAAAIIFLGQDQLFSLLELGEAAAPFHSQEAVDVDLGQARATTEKKEQAEKCNKRFHGMRTRVRLPFLLGCGSHNQGDTLGCGFGQFGIVASKPVQDIGFLHRIGRVLLTHQFDPALQGDV